MVKLVFEPFGVANLLKLTSVLDVVVALVLITLVYFGITGAGETTLVVGST